MGSIINNNYSFNNCNNNIYTIKDTEINVDKTYKENNVDYNISLIPIDYSGRSSIDIIYIIRLIDTGNMPKKADISMKIGKQNVKEYYNPDTEKNSDKLLFEITDTLMYVKYIQVIVQIQDNEDVVYLSYDLFENFKPEPFPNEEEDYDDDDEEEEYHPFPYEDEDYDDDEEEEDHPLPYEEEDYDDIEEEDEYDNGYGNDDGKGVIKMSI